MAAPDTPPDSPPPISAVEMPSGKDAGTENFPVGSVLLPARLRPHVARFYAFARAIDDIADSPDLDAAAKIDRLQGFEEAITGRDTTDPAYAKGHALRVSLEATGVPAIHGVELIAAFKQDAVKGRYATWAEMMDYCRLSAAPVGRYLIDLHGGSRAGYASSDALCVALQVINHLQDCQDDFRVLDRVYLPADWLAAEGASVSDLDRAACTPGLRRVLDRCLEGTRRLLDAARPLPGDIIDRRLGLEAAVIVSIAQTLTGRLARQDPLAQRVKLGKAATAFCAARACAAYLMVPGAYR
ncbi:squalene/phytoene synthase [Rhodospirillum rubrum F11]|uniref:Squalene/phytoene synthase n=3 Tax=Rhodospirillum rubrum TaxID=1085 RepID=Q2RYC5_RHORT|nr:squalene synthase HpnC [Rhodospirillum rubrum]ABC20870.1 Squalene/phytoene synthase [Rhodospirillum rubrum ATCC 11170]AEO46537.1 squalene/phytoene synthase [Rhodospirillum rubrum F11]MBK5952427.1 squalene synthase HpnC [Rhodospirillum rubrum]QXG80571.1 squalene synthase HpnC [Rhodospirillum rubrum]